MEERTVSEQLIDQGHPSLIGKSVIVSPDCQRVAYVARVGKKRFVVVDGQEQEQYDLIEVPSPVFSPDSQRLAYDVQIKYEVDMSDTWEGFVVVDGEKGENYNEGIEERSLVFSPDSRRVAYVATRSAGFSEEDVVVVDGQEQRTLNGFNSIESLVFSPDSQRLAYVGLFSAVGLWSIGVARRSTVVIDGQEGSHYRSIVAPPGGGGVIFDSPNELHYMARKGNAFYRVEERIT